MAQIAFTIADDKSSRLVDAYCGLYGYHSTVIEPGGKAANNPETRAQFAKRMIAQEMRYTVEKWERQQAVVSDLEIE